MKRDFVPVFLITGFLESGKTTLALSILENDRYTNGGNVLVVCCEEGEAEYDEARLKKHRGTLVNLEEPEELNDQRLAELDARVRPECVIVEYNSMWGMEKLGSLQLPKPWDWAEIVTLADGSTFENYMTNMRKLLTDPMKEADMIMINRCGEGFNKSSWRKQLRALNTNATILFENPDGSVEDGIRDEDLPYDMKADTIRITEEQFGIFYLDTMDHPERYHGRKICITGQAYKRNNFPKGFYYFGRLAMTCCSNDLSVCGWVCRGERRPDGKSWFSLTARAEKVTSPEGQAALLLHELKTERAQEPKDQYVSFVNM